MVGTYLQNEKKKKKIKKEKNRNFKLPKGILKFKELQDLNKTWEKYIFELILNDRS